MSVTSKKYDATDTRTDILSANFERSYLEFINKGTETILVILGDSTSDDDAIPIAAGAGWVSSFPCSSKVSAKSNSGTQPLLVITNRQEV